MLTLPARIVARAQNVPPKEREGERGEAGVEPRRRRDVRKIYKFLQGFPIQQRSSQKIWGILLEPIVT